MSKDGLDKTQSIEQILERAWQIYNLHPEQAEALLQDNLPMPVLNARVQVIRGALYFNQGKFAECLQQLVSALSLIEDAQDIWLARLYQELGKVHATLGNADKAQEAFYKQLHLGQTLSHQRTQASAYINLYYHSSLRKADPSESKYFLDKALPIAQELQQDDLSRTLFVNFSDYYLNSQDLEQASHFAQRALDVDKALDNPLSLSNIYFILGKIEIAKQNYPEAINHYQKIIRLSQNASLNIHAEALLALARCHLGLGDQAQALSYCEMALAKAIETEDFFAQVACHLEFSKLYKAQEKYQQSLYHFESFYHLKDKLMNEQTEKMRQALEIYYDTEALRRESEMQTRKNEVLKSYIYELEILHQEVHELSMRDHLTGLYNRRYLFEYLGLARDKVKHISVAIIDVDHFKQINDTYSHETGDEVLKSLANLLTSFSRGNDIIARYGGEEFVIIFPNTTLNNATKACQRLYDMSREHSWSSTYPDLKVTFSVGISYGKSEDHNHLLVQADQKLYKAKNAGRNCMKY